MSKALTKNPKKTKENSSHKKKFIIDRNPVYGYKKFFKNDLKGISKVYRYQTKLDYNKFEPHLAKRVESRMFKVEELDEDCEDSGMIDDSDMKKLAKAIKTTNRIQRLEITCLQFDILKEVFLNL